MKTSDYYHHVGVEAHRIAADHLDAAVEAVEADDTDESIEAVNEDIDLAAEYGLFADGRSRPFAGALGMQHTQDYVLAAEVVEASNARFVDHVEGAHPREAIRQAAVNTIRKDLHDAVFDELKMHLAERELIKPWAR